MENWHCIRTKRYKESWVAYQLMESRDEVYLPLLRERRWVRRQLQWVIQPLFPCYLFARFSANKGIHTMRYISGVAGIIVSSPEDGPIVVDEQIIATLRERSLNGYVEIKPAPFFPGEELEVIAGPFQGLRALFHQELRAGERVAVLLEMLSSRVRMELPRAYVQKKSTASNR